MLEAVSAKTRVAPDDIRRKVVLALAGGLMTIAGLGFAVGALWILAAPVWGAAAAFGIFAAAFLAASTTTWLIYLVASRRAAREAELARIHRAARVDTALTAFRVGADVGSRLRRI